MSGTPRPDSALPEITGAQAVQLQPLAEAAAIFLTHESGHVSLRGFQTGLGLPEAYLNADIMDGEGLYFVMDGIWAGSGYRAQQLLNGVERRERCYVSPG